LIKAIKQDPDLLSAFPAFQRYSRRGLDGSLKYYSAESLPKDILNWAFDLTKTNVASLYASCPGWGWRDSTKRRELQDDDARYIVVSGLVVDSLEPQQTYSELENIKSEQQYLGFVHLRFEIEKGEAVAYVYEVQIDRTAQGRGLGKFLMQLVELAARKVGVSAVMLTVFKANEAAAKLYGSLGYQMDEDSPGAVDPEGDHGYEILTKKLTQKANVNT